MGETTAGVIDGHTGYSNDVWFRYASEVYRNFINFRKGRKLSSYWLTRYLLQRKSGKWAISTLSCGCT